MFMPVLFEIECSCMEARIYKLAPSAAVLSPLKQQQNYFDDQFCESSMGVIVLPMIKPTL